MSRGVKREYSAGGVVTRGGRVLLVRVRLTGSPLPSANGARGLKRGDAVWTFPKGGVEPGETPRQAALREVVEETGWTCDVRGALALLRYSFKRKKRLVRKRVRWYWMRALEKTGSPDASEIYGVRWLAFGSARKALRYPADLRLLDAVSRRCAAGERA